MELLRTFEAKDSQGRPRKISVWANVRTTKDLDGVVSRQFGIPSLKTAEGFHVNVIEKGRYEVVPTGEILTSDDPLAE